MGFIYSSLNKSDGESWSHFDNRIARMLPFATGEVYFDLRNYNACTGEFGVYTRWNEELKAVLGYELPCGGYFVKATIAQAYKFHDLGCSLPVYMKLISHSGRLYPYRTYIMLYGRPYSLEFGGGELLPMDDRFEELAFDGDVDHQEAVVTSSASGSQRFRWNGSQMRQMFGSQGGFRYLQGSQYGYFRMTGSQRFRWNSSQMRRMFGSQGGFRYLQGSQYGYFRMTGSQRFRWNGSQMRRMFGSQGGFRYLQGSQYGYFRMTGSQRFRWNGSQMRRMFGSQRSYALGDIVQMAWSVEEQTIERRDTQDRQDRQDRMKELLMEYPQEWQLINRNRRPVKNIGGNARFGYGLDLI